VRRWRARSFILVVSEHILAELANTFSDPYFTARLSGAAIAEALDALRLDATIQRITVSVAGIATHAEDDAVLATALSARCQYLVTGDKRLLQRGAIGNTLLLSPRRFLEVLESESPG